MNDSISRQAAIDAPEKFIKDCNPEHFAGHQKFIEYMDDAEIGSFGNWQFANGFNMGLTAAEVAIKKLPSAERKKGRWVDVTDGIRVWKVCDQCGEKPLWNEWKTDRDLSSFCSKCGAEMENSDE